MTAVELRAEVAEAEARQAKEALALVEEAIRKRLLCANPDADGQVDGGSLIHCDCHGSLGATVGRGTSEHPAVSLTAAASFRPTI